MNNHLFLSVAILLFWPASLVWLAVGQHIHYISRQRKSYARGCQTCHSAYLASRKMFRLPLSCPDIYAQTSNGRLSLAQAWRVRKEMFLCQSIVTCLNPCCKKRGIRQVEKYYPRRFSLWRWIFSWYDLRQVSSPRDFVGPGLEYLRSETSRRAPKEVFRRKGCISFRRPQTIPDPVFLARSRFSS
jgi:hypothetical protein